MNIVHSILAAVAAVGATGALLGQQGGAAPPSTRTPIFAEPSASIERQLADGLAELERVNTEIAAAKAPLARRLAELEAERSSVRAAQAEKGRALDSRALDLNNLRGEVKWRSEQNDYLSNMLGEYGRNFESRLHIAELERYREPLQAAKLASENGAQRPEQVYAAQLHLLETALERLEDALGGTTFAGRAVDGSGLLARGTFAMVGPAVLFRSADGSQVGTAEQRLGSLEPASIPFVDPGMADAAGRIVANGAGMFPLDPTLGNAHKVEATKESLVEHIKAGGTVMIPIFALAALALCVAVFKWLSLMSQRKPSRRRVEEVMAAVRRGDTDGAQECAAAIRGPAGKMLTIGVEHISEPRELIEEVLYENVMTTRLRLQSILPFIAITAAAAPLLGLLGTVTGIMETFKMINVFGTGDVKTLSSGISVALITTEYGLIVAIPSLLLHSMLSRKARGVVDEMEKVALAFVNEVAKAKHAPIDPQEQVA